MGKKGNWFSAIKKVFTHDSKDKIIDLEKKNGKEKKKGFGKLRYGERNSFIPLFREPSSIEKILGDAEREHNIVFRPPPSLEQRPIAPALEEPIAPTFAPPRVASEIVRDQHDREIRYVPEPTSRTQNASATKIQAAYKGYMARRSFRALRGLVRLQGVIRGQSVLRQTKNAMKHMQMLVRVQSQIQTRRIQMLENQALCTQSQYKNDKESEVDNQEDWDDSILTKEQVDAKMQQKIEAAIKRERAMSYAYSHQLGKDMSKVAKTTTDIRSGGIPRWWNWFESQNSQEKVTSERQSIKPKQSPRSQSSNYKPFPFELDDIDAITPKSTKSPIGSIWKQTQNPKGVQAKALSPGLTKTPKPRPRATQSSYDQRSLKDDASLTSCPAFTVPNYMTPTVSAKGKTRFQDTTNTQSVTESKRRFSLPSTNSGFGSFKWGKGSFFSNRDTDSTKKVPTNKYAESLDNRSVDSSASVPVGFGRKPFNRFV